MSTDRNRRSEQVGLRERAERAAATLGSELTLVAGTPLAVWRHLRRSTPVHRYEFRTPKVQLPPHANEPGDDAVQVPDDGVGSSYRRRYHLRLRGSRLGARELVDMVAGDPNLVCPTEVANFERNQESLEQADGLQEGEELLVRVAGPWNGPVRVVERTPTSFRLQTLKGHMEAGQIEFRARDGEEDGCLVFEIESHARSGTKLFGALYDRGIGRRAQEHMWISFLDQVARQAGAEVVGGIHVETERSFE